MTVWADFAQAIKQLFAAVNMTYLSNKHQQSQQANIKLIALVVGHAIKTWSRPPRHFSVAYTKVT